MRIERSSIFERELYIHGIVDYLSNKKKLEESDSELLINCMKDLEAIQNE